MRFDLARRGAYGPCGTNECFKCILTSTGAAWNNIPGSRRSVFKESHYGKDNQLEADPAHPPAVQRSDEGRAQGEATNKASRAAQTKVEAAYNPVSLRNENNKWLQFRRQCPLRSNTLFSQLMFRRPKQQN
jgi:hypothetical protein